MSNRCHYIITFINKSRKEDKSNKDKSRKLRKIISLFAQQERKRKEKDVK